MEPTEAFRVLASVDRQYLLYELRERNGESTIGELSRRIAARRHRTTSEKISLPEIDRARVRTVHIHLPSLLEQGVIDVDWSDGTVTLADDPSVDVLFAAAEELDEWPPEPPLSRFS
ncbi:hypothetical protein HYG81_17520 [Natrinema zhouii]|uniref:DUF7344 domain-containing protein n=2 Tax=Natrinema zhouii TaxID=1710539 RepID=A0A7D6CND6_9EURY|nr:hypothetical protein [Natrinema zhouii]QLK25852.1 hypothetical protein HYG81_17520 [Natrinema zhouii]